MGVLLEHVFEPTRGELDVILESKRRRDEGVKLFAELINKGQRVYRTLIENKDPHERIIQIFAKT
jgi:hypothetical protein